MTRRTPLASNAANPAAVTSLMSNTLLAIVVATSAFVSAPISAQSVPAPTTAKPAAAKTPYEAVISTDSAEVRAAASKETGYVFGALAKGATVRVLQEEAGWVRIETSGSAFDGWVGFVKGGPGVTLSADGKSIKVATRADICAVNSEREFNPDASYRPIGFLQKGDEASVVDQVGGEGGATFFAVQLDRRTSGWIPANSFTRPAAPETTAPPSSGTAPSAPAATNQEVIATNPQSAEIEVDTETGQVVKVDATTGEKVVTDGDAANGGAAQNAAQNATTNEATAMPRTEAPLRTPPRTPPRTLRRTKRRRPTRRPHA